MVFQKQRTNHNALSLICTQLPCGHKFCKKCIEEWVKRGQDKSCPQCRNPLPPGPEKRFNLGYGMFWKIRSAIDRSRPGVEPASPLASPVRRAAARDGPGSGHAERAADQGHTEAQVHCWEIYAFGWGVAQDRHLAFVYAEKAAQQGHPGCEFNLGYYYREGFGCAQSDERATEWYQKAAGHGEAVAMLNLGCLNRNGKGVPQSYEQAAKWVKKAARHGLAAAMLNLGLPTRSRCPSELYAGRGVVGEGCSSGGLNCHE